MAQRKKMENDFTGTPAKVMRRKKPINSDHMVQIEPLTKNQQIVFDEYGKGKNLFLHGCAGSGKSFISIYLSLKEILSQNSKYEKLYIVRSLVPSREIGFLPGPQPLDAKILTPNGWTTMGNIKVGDYVISRTGKPTKVLGVYPKGKKLVYKITTTENTSTECCEDHLWLTKTFNDKKHKKDGSVKSTKEIISTLYNKNGKINHYIPRNEPVEFTKKELPIPPYVLGCILGDGSIVNSISLANTDLELIEKCKILLEDINCKLIKSKTINSITYNISSKELKSNKPPKRVLVKNIATGEENLFSSLSEASDKLNVNIKILRYRCDRNQTIENFQYRFLPPLNKWQNPIKDRLHQLGLVGKKSYDKFIPDLYKYSSINDRIELLRGLMDTDGCIKQSGNSSFTTTSKQLSEDVIELVQSLGGRATYRIRDRINSGKKRILIDKHGNERLIVTKRISYDLNISLPKNINPFYISRKANRFNPKCMHYVGIKSIVPVCEKEVQCILIEDPEHLYITDQYIVTHNTHDDKSDIYQIPYKNMVKYMFKMPSDDAFSSLYENLKTQETISFWSTSFLRGVTLDNAIIIVDEMQNLSGRELHTIMTRVGVNSKIIFCGDVRQTDLIKSSEKNGIYDFSKIIRALNEDFAMVEFEIEDIVRSSLTKRYITAQYQLNLFLD